MCDAVPNASQSTAPVAVKRPLEEEREEDEPHKRSKPEDPVVPDGQPAGAHTTKRPAEEMEAEPQPDPVDKVLANDLVGFGRLQLWLCALGAGVTMRSLA